ncbi:hypothetical protein [Paraglaciecola sp.]|uniref:hypothetical protein n=1 Tax=Paraglaciecola sp. TaxID=1920173 RepID=UPI003F4AAD74
MVLDNVILSAKCPKVVARLQQAYQSWWKSIEHADDNYTPFIINPEKQNTIMITTQNLMGERVYYSAHDNRAGKLATNGYTYIDVEKPGRYKISLYRWPKELNLPLTAKTQDFVVDPKIHDRDFPFYHAKSAALSIQKASLNLGEKNFSAKVSPKNHSIDFIVELAKGEQQIRTEFELTNGDKTCAYYTYIEAVN